MGMTIHYELRSDDAGTAARAREAVSRLRQAALDLPFAEVGPLIELTGGDCDYRHASGDAHWLLVQAAGLIIDPGQHWTSVSVPPEHLIAFSTWPGEGSEPANFGLRRLP